MYFDKTVILKIKKAPFRVPFYLSSMTAYFTFSTMALKASG